MTENEVARVMLFIVQCLALGVLLFAAEFFELEIWRQVLVLACFVLYGGLQKFSGRYDV